MLEIDHIVPHSRGGTSLEENLALACPMCNGHKADRIEAIDPETHQPEQLYHPRVDSWRDHFEWSDDGTMIIGRTPQGRATVLCLQMNHPDMVTVRRLWASVGWHPPD